MPCSGGISKNVYHSCTTREKRQHSNLHLRYKVATLWLVQHTGDGRDVHCNDTGARDVESSNNKGLIMIRTVSYWVVSGFLGAMSIASGRPWFQHILDAARYTYAVM
jgi:hypothetical protein